MQKRWPYGKDHLLYAVYSGNARIDGQPIESTVHCDLVMAVRITLMEVFPISAVFVVLQPDNQADHKCCAN